MEMKVAAVGVVLLVAMVTVEARGPPFRANSKYRKKMLNLYHKKDTNLSINKKKAANHYSAQKM